MQGHGPAHRGMPLRYPVEPWMENMDDLIQKALRLIEAPAGEPAEGRGQVAPAQGSDVELLDAYSRAVIKVVEGVSPVVVGISAGREPQAGGEQAGAGSGVLITPDGYILTNDHVVHGARRLTATLADGKSLSANLVGSAQWKMRNNYFIGHPPQTDCLTPPRRDWKPDL